MTRGLFASALALALTPVLAASRPPREADEPVPPAGDDDYAFAEIYRGRRIEGLRNPAWFTADTQAEEWQVTIDGRPLHLMRRADGTWLSMIDHYRSYPTPLEAARAAVDEMGPKERLRDLAPGPMEPGNGERRGGGHQHPRMGGDHGVHA